MIGVGYIGGTNQAEFVRLQVVEACANGGIPVLHPTLANTSGIRKCTTTTCEDAIGLLKNPVATRNTAQQSDNSDPAALGLVDVNPHLLIKARMCGGATAGTALTAVANTAVSTDGLTLTFSASQSTYDDAYCVGATGANAGIMRKMEAVTTTATLEVAFPFDIAVGDEFYLFTPGPGEDDEVQLTSDLTEIDVTANNSSNLTLRMRNAQVKAADERGDIDSHAIIYFSEHLLGGGASI